MLNSRAGQSLLQTLIALGLLSFMALLFSNGEVLNLKSKALTVNSGTWEALSETMEAVLSYRDTCSPNFANLDNVPANYDPTAVYAFQSLGYTPATSEAVIQVGQVYEGIRIDSLELKSSMPPGGPVPTATVDYDPSIAGDENYQIYYGFLEMKGTILTGPNAGQERQTKSFLAKYKQVPPAGSPHKTICYSKNDSTSLPGDTGAFLFSDQQACEMLGGTYPPATEMDNFYFHPSLAQGPGSYVPRTMSRCRLDRLVVSASPADAMSAPLGGTYIAGDLKLTNHHHTGLTYNHRRGQLHVNGDLYVRNPASGTYVKPCLQNGTDCPAQIASNRTIDLRNSRTQVSVSNAVEVNCNSTTSQRKFLVDASYTLQNSDPGTWTGTSSNLILYRYFHDTTTRVGTLRLRQSTAWLDSTPGAFPPPVATSTPSQITATCARALAP